MKTPQVVIILVNWNGITDTLACLASLEQLDYPNYQTIVIDNGSKDNSVKQIRTHYPEVTLFETGENLGFVGGNNIAMQHPLVAKTDYVLLLNNDTEVAPDFLSLLVEVAQSDKKIGIVGPTIYYFDEPETIWSAGGGIDWNKGMTHMVNLNELDEGQLGDTPRSMDFVTGCALLIKRLVIKEVGLLDPRFFAYYEEAEWCVRTTRAGFKILHVPSSKIWHKISIVSREASPQVHYYMVRNRLLFLKLSQASLRAWLFTCLRNYTVILINWSINPKWRHKAPQRRAMWRAIFDYMRGRFGRVDIS
ncbi:glycosyltransferase family 2 protein [Anaerolineales bacterium HSG25]|nr:glycosyltransferase family 2 protein [Anaerolineales bacterium HSG25]